MIRGEGAGYLKLPEFWLFAEEKDAPGADKRTTVSAAPGELAKKEIRYGRERASVWDAPEEGFPKTFWLKFKLSGAGSDERVRIYYDYDGRFHLGHRLLLGLSSDTPALKMHTTGTPKRLALSPLAAKGAVRAVRIERESAVES